MTHFALSLSPDLFAQAFPFHLVMNQDLAILQSGEVLQRIIPKPLIGSYMGEHFRIHRPHIPLSWAAIRQQTRSLFLLESLHHPMQLKGQMVIAEDPPLLFFLGSPWLTHTALLGPLGLKLKDFAIHDPVVDFLFLLQAQNTALADLKNLTEQLSQQQAQLQAEIAERQQAERQAQLYQASQLQIKELEKLNRLKDDFLSTVSHELRTPISNIKMAVHLLKLSPTEAQRSRYLDILQTECTREANLIDDLLDLQCLESGSKLLELTTISLKNWLTTLIEPFQERTQGCQQTLQLELMNDIPDLISDATCLERILAELLNNACKYTPPGEKIIVTAQAYPGSGDRPTPETAADFVLLTVRNSGVEIPAHELPQIFEKFYRIRGSDPWKRGGTGLGLALVQKLVEHLGGNLQAESSLNQTWFTLRLPIVLSMP
ncbi:MAG TPA: ATP-binding protein [Coleofasciculaceae cyanobacterium]|jgi:signal transduction histidine kinase